MVVARVDPIGILETYDAREHLADFKRPKQIFITDAIPRTATGKIQRGKVAKAYRHKAKAS